MIKINNRIIAREAATFFIAEIGSNHDGSLETAKKLIDECFRIGADAVKFQSFSAAKLVARDHPAYAALQKLELSYDWHKELASYCSSIGIVFLSTPFDEEKVDWLEEVGVPAYKIASGDLTYYKLLSRVARTGKPLLLATGIAELGEIKSAVKFIESGNNKNIAILHCVSNYPPKDADINLNSIVTMNEAFSSYVIGLSDHSSGDVAPLGAVALGARIIEKHITISRALKGPDHPYALEVAEFGEMIQRIRRLEEMLGRAEKKPVESEIVELQWARRGIYFNKNMEAGDMINESFLEYLRPNDGIGAQEYRDLIGKRLSCDVVAGSAVTTKMLK